MNKKFFTILLLFLVLCSCAKNPQKKVFTKDNSYQIEKDKITTNSKKISKVWFENFDFPKGSVVLDPFRMINSELDGVKVIRIGDNHDNRL